MQRFNPKGRREALLRHDHACCCHCLFGTPGLVSLWEYRPLAGTWRGAIRAIVSAPCSTRGHVAMGATGEGALLGLLGSGPYAQLGIMH